MGLRNGQRAAPGHTSVRAAVAVCLSWCCRLSRLVMTNTSEGPTAIKWTSSLQTGLCSTLDWDDYDLFIISWDDY